MRSSRLVLAAGVSLLMVIPQAFAAKPISQDDYDRHVDRLYWAYRVPASVTDKCSALYPQLAHSMKENLGRWQRFNQPIIEEVTVQWQALAARSPTLTVNGQPVSQQDEMASRIDAYPDRIVSSQGGPGDARALEACTSFSEQALGQLDFHPLKGIETWQAVFLYCEHMHLCDGIRRPDSGKAAAAFTLVEQFALPQPGPVAGHLHGFELDADTMAVAYGGGWSGGPNNSRGWVLVLTRTAQGWVEQARIPAPAECPYCSDFGEHIALSGDTLLVSSMSEGRLSNGAVYAYQRTGQQWTLRARWTPSEQLHSLAGEALATSGSYALVGAPNVDTGFFPLSRVARGAVYIYRFQDGAWHADGELSPDSPGKLKSFGRSLAMTQDTAVVGSDQGVFVFRLRNGRWRQEAVLDRQIVGSASDSVAIEGDQLLASTPIYAGRVMHFSRTGDGWTQTANLTSTPPSTATDTATNAATDSGGFGYRAKLHGGLVAASASWVNGKRGKVIVFRPQPDGTVQQWSVTPPNPADEPAYFGAGIAWYGDQLAVRNEQGKVFFFSLTQPVQPMQTTQPVSPPPRASNAQ